MREENPMISKTHTTTEQGYIGSAGVGGLIGTLLLVSELLRMTSTMPIGERIEARGFGIPYVGVIGFGGGAILGALIGAVAAKMSRVAGWRKGMGLSIVFGIFVGAIGIGLAVLSIQSWGYRSEQVPLPLWPIFLALLGGALAGIVGSFAGRRQHTSTTCICATCGGFVRCDALVCKHCQAPFYSNTN